MKLLFKKIIKYIFLWFCNTFKGILFPFNIGKNIANYSKISPDIGVKC